MQKLYRTSFPLSVAILLLAISMLFITYFIERTAHVPLLAAYSIAFAAYLFIAYKSQASQLRNLLIVAVIIRLMCLFALPNLSDDFYRFIWDGLLWHKGVHPFLYTPAELMEKMPGLMPINLFENLNSPHYYSIYPPLHQAVFWFATWAFSNHLLGTVVVMRLILIIAELAGLVLMLRLLQYYQLPTKRVLLYVLNPLVILEVTVNLHFEGVLLTALLASFYFWEKSSFKKSAFSYAAAIAVKLNPLILSLLLLRKAPKYKKLLFVFFSILFSLFFFLAIYDTTLLSGMGNSLGLYFQSFEFNASLYYVINGLLSSWKGYNMIALSGSIMVALAVLGILTFSLLAFKEQSLPTHALWLYLIFLLCSLTVHPWYVIPLIGFSIFTHYRFPILWSFLIFFTYWGYTDSGFVEKSWVIGLEYLLLFGLILWELKRNRQTNVKSNR